MSISGSIRIATLAAASLIGGASIASSQCPVSPNYSPDFSANQTCLTLNSANSTYPVTFSPLQLSTTTPPTVLRLTPAVGGLANSAWYATPQNVTTGFSTTFTFQDGLSTSQYNADGFAFVFQNSGAAALGPGGCGMGFGGSASGCAALTGIPNSVAIAFNTFYNPPANGVTVDPVDSNNVGSGNDVEIQSCSGGAANMVDVGPNCTVAYAILPSNITIADDQVHSVTITYAPSASSTCGVSGLQSCSTIDVMVDNTDIFGGPVLFDMTTITSNTAYIGFTAGTGGDNDIQDITSWTYTPAQTQTGTVTPTQTAPTTFNYNGGFATNSPNSGFNFSALQNSQTTNPQIVQMTVTAIPMTQLACNALLQNTVFAGANCFVYQNGGGLGQDTSVLFEVTCTTNGVAGSCGSGADPFFADLGTQFSFTCTENPNLQCPATTSATSGGSFGLPHISSDGLPGVGFLKGEGNALHPCTPASSVTPLFTSNQLESFSLGDTSGGAKGGSGGTTSCWVMTYQTPGVTPTVPITSPQATNYPQNSSQTANYTCTAQSTGSSNTPSVGPYLTVPPSPVGTCAATNSYGGTSVGVASGSSFDTSTLGPHTFTAQVQDSAMNSNQSTVTYYVVAPPVISGPSSAIINVGSALSVVFSATGYPTPTFSELGNLPAGITFVDNGNGNATLSGTPTANGIFPITITAQNSQGAPTLVFTLEAAANVPAAGNKCNGLYDGTFKGNLTISAGQTCTFIGGGVTGNITESGGKLALAGAAIGGNIVVNGGGFAIGSGTSIKGNLSILEAPKSAVQSTVCGATIGANLQVLESSTPVAIGSPTAACPGNTIAGSLNVSGNNAAVAIYNNTVGGSLLDLANAKPTQVFSNHVKGTLSCLADSGITGGSNTALLKTGQCSKF